MKKKRMIYNLLTGFLGQVITICLGFILPRLFMVNYGSEMNGMMSSVKEIYAYIALLELGIGAATIQSLYKPIAENNKLRINQILSATSIYYKKIGMGYLICIIAISIGYPLIITTDIPYTTIVFIFFTTGIGNVVNFWVQGKYKLLLMAEGKYYITFTVMTLVAILNDIIKIILIYLGYDIISVQIAYCIISLIPMLYYTFYIRWKYKWLDLKVEPDYEAIRQKDAVMIHKLSNLVFNNTDVLILTMFCGLKVVSVYVLYNTIFSIVEKFLNTINNSVSATLGQMYQTNKDEYVKYLNVYELVFVYISVVASTVLYFIVNPFITIYTKGITDINYIVSYLPLLFTIYKMSMWIRIPVTNTIAYAGHYKQTQNKALLESVLNIVISVICVNFVGIQGILIGSIVATIYGGVYSIAYSNTNLLKNNKINTTKLYIITYVSFFLMINLFSVQDIVMSYKMLIILSIKYGLICSLLYGVIYILTNLKIIKFIMIKKHVSINEIA